MSRASESEFFEQKHQQSGFETAEEHQDDISSGLENQHMNNRIFGGSGGGIDNSDSVSTVSQAGMGRSRVDRAPNASQNRGGLAPRQFDSDPERAEQQRFQRRSNRPQTRGQMDRIDNAMGNQTNMIRDIFRNAREVKQELEGLLSGSASISSDTQNILRGQGEMGNRLFQNADDILRNQGILDTRISDNAREILVKQHEMGKKISENVKSILSGQGDISEHAKSILDGLNEIHGHLSEDTQRILQGQGDIGSRVSENTNILKHLLGNSERTNTQMDDTAIRAQRMDEILGEIKQGGTDMANDMFDNNKAVLSGQGEIRNLLETVDPQIESVQASVDDITDHLRDFGTAESLIDRFTAALDANKDGKISSSELARANTDKTIIDKLTSIDATTARMIRDPSFRTRIIEKKTSGSIYGANKLAAFNQVELVSQGLALDNTDTNQFNVGFS